MCPERWGTDFVPNYIFLIFEYGTVFPWCGEDALTALTIGARTTFLPGVGWHFGGEFTVIV
jgi:hypothetical protein